MANNAEIFFEEAGTVMGEELTSRWAASAENYFLKEPYKRRVLVVSQEYMEVTYDKFTFRVMKDYLYHPEECWVKREGDLVVVGVTDFLQTNAGDVAFIELPEAGKEVKQGDEAGVIETIKTTVTLISPVSGEIVEVNTALEDDPQLINSDAYGEGWIFKIRPTAWDQDAEKLMAAEAYFPVMEEKIKAALEK